MTASLVSLEAWYADGHTAVIRAATRGVALDIAFETVGLVAVFAHPSHHPEGCHSVPWSKEQEEV